MNGPLWQRIAVAVIVLAAVAIALGKLFRHRRDGSCCDCGCSGCKLKDACTRSDAPAPRRGKR